MNMGCQEVYSKWNTKGDKMVTFIDGIKAKKQEFQDGNYLFKLNIKFDKFVESIGKYVNSDGYVNLDIAESKNGTWYVKLNEWKKNANNNI